MKDYSNSNIKQLNNTFKSACLNSNLNVLSALVPFVDKIRENIKVKCFNWACEKNNLEIVQFLIFDINIEKSENINQCLEENETVSNMFNIRELNKQLSDELNENVARNRKMKI